MGGVVPLSEHEQRQLEQIEQALYREDPKFGRLVRSSDPRVHYKRKLAQAIIGVAVGAGLLAAGVVTHRVYLEAAGRRSRCWPWSGRWSTGGGTWPGSGPCGPRRARRPSRARRGLDPEAPAFPAARRRPGGPG